jgi:hypothetical protein
MLGGLVVTIVASAALSLYLPFDKGNALIFSGLLFPVIWVAAMTLLCFTASNRSAVIGAAASSAVLVILCAARWI